MIYSIYRWEYFNYPGYEFHFNGMASMVFDEEYLIVFYNKVGFTEKMGYFNLKVEKNEFHKFCTNAESKISEMFFAFLIKQNNNFNYKLATYQNIFLNTISSY